MTLVKDIDITNIHYNMVVIFSPSYGIDNNPFYNIGLIEHVDLNNGFIDMIWLYEEIKLTRRYASNDFKNIENDGMNAGMRIYQTSMSIKRINEYFDLFKPIGW